MNVLVTGGAGFIGCNLVRSLLASGNHVRVLDDLSTGARTNLDECPSAELIVGDIRDGEVVAEAMREVNVVYHLAALPSVARSTRDPLRSHSVNAGGTLVVLLAARDQGAHRVVYASSSSVYGDTPTLPKHEDMPVTTMSPYAASKLSGEAYCRSFAHVYGLETVALRFFNVFGPYQDPASDYAAVIPKFITAMLAGQAPVIFGDGTQSRDFTFVANVVQALRLAGEADTAAVGEAVNVGCGGRISLLDLVETLGSITGTAVKPTFAPARPGDVRHSEASIEKASRLLGYRPLATLEDGLAYTAEWFAARSAADHHAGDGSGAVHV